MFFKGLVTYNVQQYAVEDFIWLHWHCIAFDCDLCRHHSHAIGPLRKSQKKSQDAQMHWSNWRKHHPCTHSCVFSSCVNPRTSSIFWWKCHPHGIFQGQRVPQGKNKKPMAWCSMSGWDVYVFHHAQEVALKEEKSAAVKEYERHLCVLRSSWSLLYPSDPRDSSGHRRRTFLHMRRERHWRVPSDCQIIITCCREMRKMRKFTLLPACHGCLSPPVTQPWILITAGGLNQRDDCTLQCFWTWSLKRLEE